MKVWNCVGIELAIPGSAVRLANDCAMGPGDKYFVRSSPHNKHFFENRKRKVFKTLKTFTVPKSHELD